MVGKDASSVVKRQLSIDGIDIDKVDAVIAIVHGPCCEEELSSLYTDTQRQTTNPNDHWSMMLWCREGEAEGTAFHYDSLGHFNRERCLETVRVLRKYGILPKSLNGVYRPKFVPEQKGSWECGYFVLLYLYLITRTANTVNPLTEEVVGKNKELIQTLDRVSGTFRCFLMQGWENLNAAALYDF